MSAYTDEEHYYQLDNMTHRSSQHLRKVFLDRWCLETGQQWEDTQVQRDSNLQFIKKNDPDFKEPFGLRRLKFNSIYDWDIGLLSRAITSLGGNKAKNKDENNAVHELRKLRNHLAHPTGAGATKKIPEDEYIESRRIIIESLRVLGMEELEIQKLVTISDVTSSLNAFKTMLEFHSQAEQHSKNERMDEAKKLYTSAIDIPCLSKRDKGEAYEKRAEHYLKYEYKPQITKTDSLNLALSDATEARTLNDHSWKADYLLGKCYRLKYNYPEALEHLQRAVGISPNQKEVQAELDSCRLAAAVMLSNDYRNPSQMPKTLTEITMDQNGLALNSELTDEFMLSQEKFHERLSGGEDFMRGEKYFLGWKTEWNVKEAVKYYFKAANLKHPGAMLRLATCFRDGTDVNRDLEESLRLFKELAEVNPILREEKTRKYFKACVAEAQCAMGFAYEGGFGVAKKPEEAALWYTRSAENGSGAGAHNLGEMYKTGWGVRRDYKTAEKYWKLALTFNNVSTYPALMQHYFELHEPQEARKIYEKGKALEEPYLSRISLEEFEKIEAQAKEIRLDHECRLKPFEEKLNLDCKGLSLKDRLNREESFSNPEFSSYIRHRANMRGDKNNECCGGTFIDLTGKMLPEIARKANAGSEFAKQILETYSYNGELQGLLEKNNFTEDDKKHILETYYNCVALEFPVCLSTNNREKLEAILSEFKEKRCGTKGDDDMKIRLCYFKVNLEGFAYSADYKVDVELLKEGVRRYPENVLFYKALTERLHIKYEFKEGREYAEEGLKLFPQNPDLLIYRAMNLQRENDTPNRDMQLKTIKAFEEFLQVAPKDHRFVPGAFYTISELYLTDEDDAVISAEDMKLAKENYQKGLVAEEDQLPCFMPYGGDCNITKTRVEARIEKSKKKEKETVRKQENNPEPVPKLSILDRKDYLNCQARKHLIILHRQLLKIKSASSAAEKNVLVHHEGFLSKPPELKQTPVKNCSLVTAITLKEIMEDMNLSRMKNNIFQNRSIDLTLIDDAKFCQKFIQLVTEDENGDVTTVLIYNNFWGNDIKIRGKFEAGCRITVFNPYMMIGHETLLTGIRVYEQDCILHCQKLVKMCRFCGEENATKKCKKCNRPYCSRECRQLDLDLWNHKLICSKEKKC